MNICFFDYDVGHPTDALVVLPEIKRPDQRIVEHTYRGGALRSTDAFMDAIKDRVIIHCGAWQRHTEYQSPSLMNHPHVNLSIQFNERHRICIDPYMYLMAQGKPFERTLRDRIRGIEGLYNEAMQGELTIVDPGRGRKVLDTRWLVKLMESILSRKNKAVVALELELNAAQRKLAAAQKRVERAQKQKRAERAEAEANLEAYLTTAGEQEDLSVLADLEGNLSSVLEGNDEAIDEAMLDLGDATIRAESTQEEFVYALYQTDKCPECGTGKAHLELISDFLLCQKCNKATAVAELELLDAQRQ